MRGGSDRVRCGGGGAANAGFVDQGCGVTIDTGGDSWERAADAMTVRYPESIDPEEIARKWLAARLWGVPTEVHALADAILSAPETTVTEVASLSERWVYVTVRVGVRDASSGV